MARPVNADRPLVEEARAHAKELELALRYTCDLRKLAPPLSERFVQFGVDESLGRYFERARLERHGAFMTWLHHGLRGFLSDFDINGLLGTYPMHVLGTEQWEQLLGRPGGRLLDVGAGNGDVTVQLAPLFDQVTTVETARLMARRLARRGYTCHRADLASTDVPDAPWDVITLLNVLDRCDRPLTLLSNLRAALSDGGRLVLTLVLPYKPFVYEGGMSRSPTELLPISKNSWEGATNELVENVLLPLGFEIEACSRVPYLSGGDAHRALYELDDVLLVCRAQGQVRLLGG
jgi:SAM-dependent methyltransferase